MTWAGRRQLFIILLVFGTASAFLFWHFRSAIYVAPTCTDAKQNGDEVGVDCGGACLNFCDSQIKDPIVVWRRAFPVTDSVYNAVAYVENGNDAVIQEIPYEFRLYDEKGGFVARANGITRLNPLGRYAIVETGIKVGNQKVGKTTFEFEKPAMPWLRVNDDIKKLRAQVSEVLIEDTDTAPKVSAMVTNTSPTVTLSNTEIAVVLYDANNNAINTSKTYLQTIKPNEKIPVFFTWPKPFPETVARYEIIPILDIFRAKK